MIQTKAARSSFCSQFEADLHREFSDHPSSVDSCPNADRNRKPDAAAAGVDSLPCLNRNNCIKQGQKSLVEKWNRLSSKHRKVAAALRENVQALAQRYGLEHLAFFTLTFKRLQRDIKEAQRNFHALATNIMRERFVDWIVVVERHKNGGIHFHLIVVVEWDVRTGVDFQAFERGDYRTAGPRLRAEWAFWRQTFGKRPDGFGRHEFLPIKSTAEGIGKYVGKYINKHIEQRREEDKGVRLVRYSKGAAAWGSNFTWCSPGADVYRAKLKLLAEGLGCTAVNYSERFQAWFGDHWAFVLGPVIESIRLPLYRSGRHAKADYPEFEAPDGADLSAISEVRVNDGQDAGPSLRAAIVAATYERWRRHRGEHKESVIHFAQDGAERSAWCPRGSREAEAFLEASRHQGRAFTTWIERSCGDG